MTSNGSGTPRSSSTSPSRLRWHTSPSAAGAAVAVGGGSSAVPPPRPLTWVSPLHRTPLVPLKTPWQRVQECALALDLCAEGHATSKAEGLFGSLVHLLAASEAASHEPTSHPPNALSPSHTTFLIDALVKHWHVASGKVQEGAVEALVSLLSPEVEAETRRSALRGLRDVLLLDSTPAELVSSVVTALGDLLALDASGSEYASQQSVWSVCFRRRLLETFLALTELVYSTAAELAYSPTKATQKAHDATLDHFIGQLGEQTPLLESGGLLPRLTDQLTSMLADDDRLPLSHRHFLSFFGAVVRLHQSLVPPADSSDDERLEQAEQWIEDLNLILSRRAGIESEFNPHNNQMIQLFTSCLCIADSYSSHGVSVAPFAEYYQRYVLPQLDEVDALYRGELVKAAACLTPATSAPTSAPGTPVRPAIAATATTPTNPADARDLMPVLEMIESLRARVKLHEQGTVSSEDQASAAVQEANGAEDVPTTAVGAAKDTDSVHAIDSSSARPVAAASPPLVDLPRAFRLDASPLAPSLAPPPSSATTAESAELSSLRVELSRARDANSMLTTELRLARARIAQVESESLADFGPTPAEAQADARIRQLESELADARAQLARAESTHAVELECIRAAHATTLDEKEADHVALLAKLTAQLTLEGAPKSAATNGTDSTPTTVMPPTPTLAPMALPTAGDHAIIVSLREQLASTEATWSDARRRLDAEHARADQLARELSDARALLDTSKSELADVESRLAESEQVVANLRREHAAADIASSATISDLQQALERQEDINVELHDRLDAIEAQQEADDDAAATEAAAAAAEAEQEEQRQPDEEADPDANEDANANDEEASSDGVSEAAADNASTASGALVAASFSATDSELVSSLRAQLAAVESRLAEVESLADSEVDHFNNILLKQQADHDAMLESRAQEHRSTVDALERQLAAARLANEAAALAADEAAALEGQLVTLRDELLLKEEENDELTDLVLALRTQVAQAQENAHVVAATGTNSSSMPDDALVDKLAAQQSLHESAMRAAQASEQEAAIRLLTSQNQLASTRAELDAAATVRQQLDELRQAHALLQTQADQLRQQLAHSRAQATHSRPPSYGTVDAATELLSLQNDYSTLVEEHHSLSSQYALECEHFHAFRSGYTHVLRALHEQLGELRASAEASRNDVLAMRTTVDADVTRALVATAVHVSGVLRVSNERHHQRHASLQSQHQVEQARLTLQCNTANMEVRSLQKQLSNRDDKGNAANASTPSDDDATTDVTDTARLVDDLNAKLKASQSQVAQLSRDLHTREESLALLQMKYDAAAAARRQHAMTPTTPNGFSTPGLSATPPPPPSSDAVRELEQRLNAARFNHQAELVEASRALAAAKAEAATALNEARAALAASEAESAKHAAATVAAETRIASLQAQLETQSSLHDSLTNQIAHEKRASDLATQQAAESLAAERRANEAAVKEARDALATAQKQHATALVDARTTAVARLESQVHELTVALQVAESEITQLRLESGGLQAAEAAFALRFQEAADARETDRADAKAVFEQLQKQYDTLLVAHDVATADEVRLRKQNETLTRHIKALRADVESCEARCEELVREKTEAVQTVLEHEATVAELNRRVVLLEADLDEHVALADQHAEHMAACDSSREDSTRLRASLTQVTAERDALSARLEDERASARDVRELRDGLSQAHRQLDQARADLTVARQRAEHAAAQRATEHDAHAAQQTANQTLVANLKAEVASLARNAATESDLRAEAQKRLQEARRTADLAQREHDQRVRELESQLHALAPSAASGAAGMMSPARRIAAIAPSPLLGSMLSPAAARLAKTETPVKDTYRSGAYANDTASTPNWPAAATATYATPTAAPTTLMTHQRAAVAAYANSSPTPFSPSSAASPSFLTEWAPPVVPRYEKGGSAASIAASYAHLGHLVSHAPARDRLTPSTTPPGAVTPAVATANGSTSATSDTAYTMQPTRDQRAPTSPPTRAPWH